MAEMMARQSAPMEAGLAGPVAAAPPARLRRSRTSSLALHLTLTMASLIALFPIVWVVLSSFKPGVWIQSSELSLVKEPTLENYRYVLTETNFPVWFLNSVLVGAASMIIGVLLSATTGYALSRFNFPWRRQLMLTFLVTQMFPVAILIV